MRRRKARSPPGGLPKVAEVKCLITAAHCVIRPETAKPLWKTTSRYKAALDVLQVVYAAPYDRTLVETSFVL